MENNNTTHQISHEAENSALQSANETPQKDGQPRCAVASGSALVFRVSGVEACDNRLIGGLPHLTYDMIKNMNPH